VHQVVATVLLLSGDIEDGGGANFLLAARVLVAGAERTSEAGLDPSRLLMHVTITHFSDMVENAAAVALEDVQIRPDLPIYLAPRNSISFSYERDKLLQVPALVDDVLRANLTVAVDVALGLGTVHDLALAHSEQFVAVSALVQVVGLLLEKQLKLLHEEARHELVLALLQLVQAIERYLARHITNYLRVDAAHVDLHARDFFNIFDEELETFFHEAVNFEEVSRNQNGDRILDVQLWSVILLDGRLLGVHTVVAALLQSDLEA
jgi:hypothetical protein